jgi:hypothetical protein
MFHSNGLEINTGYLGVDRGSGTTVKIIKRLGGV